MGRSVPVDLANLADLEDVVDLVAQLLHTDHRRPLILSVQQPQPRPKDRSMPLNLSLQQTQFLLTDQ